MPNHCENDLYITGPDADVAAMIGDSTVSLIQTTYGKPRPGEPKLSFRRSNGTASWEEFKP